MVQLVGVGQDAIQRIVSPSSRIAVRVIKRQDVGRTIVGVARNSREGIGAADDPAARIEYVRDRMPERIGGHEQIAIIVMGKHCRVVQIIRDACFSPIGIKNCRGRMPRWVGDGSLLAD